MPTDSGCDLGGCGLFSGASGSWNTSWWDRLKANYWPFIVGWLTPIKGGPPNGRVFYPDKKGGGTLRHYDENGNATKDVDFGHDHGAGDPHVHDWNGTVRSPGRGIGPNEPIYTVPLPDMPLGPVSIPGLPMPVGEVPVYLY